MEYLFVYGTLRRGTGHPMHRLLARQAEFIGVASFPGRLYEIGAFPGALRSDRPGDSVHGEVYRLRQWGSVLRQLDCYEGVVRHDRQAPFRRERAWATLENGTRLEAWIYLYNRPVRGRRRILSGDYLDPSP